MKIKGLIIALLCACSFTTIQAQNDLFDKLSNNKEISTVFISKALLQMGAGMDMGIDGAKDLAGKLEQIEIYTSEKKEGVAIVRAAMKTIDTSKYQILMQVKEGDENIVFYSQQNGDTFRDFIMHVDETSECTLIRLKGTFTAADIQKVMDKHRK